MPEIKVELDRIEDEGKAVCYGVDDELECVIPKEWLPDGIEPGDEFTLTLEREK